MLTPKLLFLCFLCFGLLIVSMVGGAVTIPNQEHETTPLDVFDVATRTIEERFFEPARLGQDYQQLKSECRAAIAHAENPVEALPVQVNRLLDSLNASHTYYMTPESVEYYRIGGVFQQLPQIAKLFPDGKAKYPSLGLLSTEIKDQWYVENVLPKSQAEKAGLLIGDRLWRLNDQPFHPILSLRDVSDGQTVDVTILREEKEMHFSLEVHWIDPQAEFLQALNDSFQIMERHGKKIGYAHFYSYAGNEFQQALQDATSWGTLADADAIVLDLRFGMGGASLSYLNLFQRNLPTMTMIDREGNRRSLNGQWTKPVVYLIDGSARSGKETLAYGAKKLGFAKLVGMPTAGAVVGGSPFPMPNGDLLYLAVSDVLVDGKHLEGHPVQPDVRIPLDLTNCHGIDTQKEAALQTAFEMVHSETPNER